MFSTAADRSTHSSRLSGSFRFRLKLVLHDDQERINVFKRYCRDPKLQSACDAIESKMGAIEVLRSELNQVFDHLDTLKDRVEGMQAAVKDDSGKELG